MDFAPAPITATRTVTVDSAQGAKTYAPVWLEKGQTVTFRVSGA